MRRLIADGVKVQTCVTSPPYFGLRDYGHPGQLGLEATPEEYVAHMVEVFGLAREMLADDGVLWLNIGDSYWGGKGQSGHADAEYQKDRVDAGISFNVPSSHTGGKGKTRPQDGKHSSIKPKDLVGIPWMLAFALRADGWYLRQDIIWHKPNPMPESVTDRCTKAHEYLFLLSKSERYYFDAAAINEKAVSGTDLGLLRGHGAGGDTADKVAWHAKSIKDRQDDGVDSRTGNPSASRNRRSVWTIPTAPYSGAHFATFPPALIEPCILAGSRPGDIVFDPFFGSGTTGQVAQNLGRHWLGCELNRDYEPLQQRRTAQTGMVF